MGRSTTIRFFGFGLVALSLGAVACAAGDDGEGGGGNSGTGGLVGGVTGGTGGTTAATGGVTGATGGVTGATGGVTGATGGTTSVSVECPAAGADFATDGYASNGTLCGYIFTGSWDGATVAPPCGTGECFVGTDTCATGEVPAEDAEAMTYPGILVGMNVQQNSMGDESTWSSSGAGLTFTFSATGASNVRAVVQVGATDYCFDGATSGAAIPWSDFKTECWGTTGTALPAGAAITAVLLQVPATMMAQSPELCLNGVQVN